MVDDFRESLDDGSTGLLEATRSESGRLNAPLYLVGGPVRDLLLRRPSTDLDLVTEGNVEVLARRVAEAVGSKALLHRRFGTATVKSNGVRLDLATARKEVYARPGALPLVTAGTIEEDLQRRDFTINAMALGLSGRHVRPAAGSCRWICRLDPRRGEDSASGVALRTTPHAFSAPYGTSNGSVSGWILVRASSLLMHLAPGCWRRSAPTGYAGRWR